MPTYRFFQIGNNYSIIKLLANDTEANNFITTYLDPSWAYDYNPENITEDFGLITYPWYDALKTKYINVTFDGGGSAITTGLQAEVQIPYGGTVSSWDIFSTATGSCVIDVLRSADFSSYPTFTSIAGTEKPTLATQSKNQDINLTSWSAGLTAGNILRFNVDSASTVEKVYLTIKINIA
jgi:hypothetical protein